MKKTIRAALIETKNVADLSEITPLKIEKIKKINLEHNIELIKDAVNQGTQIICLNELFPAPYFAIEKEADKKWIDFAESVEKGSTIKALRKVSKDLNIIILAPIYEQATHGNRYNTTVVIEEGNILGKYRKTHIPHGHNEQGNFTEGFYYNASDDEKMNIGYKKISGHPLFPVFKTGIGKIGIATCFDRHFQYVWQHLENGGAQIVFSPAVTFGETSREAWNHEFPTEAIRHGFFIGGSNRIGQEFQNGPIFFGESYFVGPNGKKLPNVSNYKNLVIADLNLTELERDSSGWNLTGNKRLDLEKSILNKL